MLTQPTKVLPEFFVILVGFVSLVAAVRPRGEQQAIIL
jgi:hypothetical protein